MTSITAHPLSWPVGPMEVENMRLKSMGSERSLPVIGDFMLNFLTVSPNCALSIPSI